MTFEWKLYARDPLGNRAGEIDDYTEAKLIPIYNDVGTWEITMNRRTAMVAKLTTPQWGITACRNDSVIFSGGMTHSAHSVDQNSNRNSVQISGLTDDAWLTRRVVSPSPAESVPPYTAQATDVRTGKASTVIMQYVNVNAGPGAISQRQIPGLAIAADPLIGATVSGTGRWDTNLLQLIQPLAAAGGVGFKIAQVGNSLQFQVYASTDRSASVCFSSALGNLSGFTYDSTAPVTNYVYVGATGTGTARVIKEVPDSAAIATWGRIEGPMVNQSGTSNPTEIANAASDALLQGSEQASLTITPIETPSLMYGIDYALGDKVTVQLEGPASSPYAGTGQIVDILRSVEIHLTQGGPQTVTPTIGTAARKDVLRVIRAVREMQKRLNILERQ